MNFGLSLTTVEVDRELTKLHTDLDSNDTTRVLRALDYMLKNTDGLISTCTDQYATLFEHREDILHSLERLLDVVSPLSAAEYPFTETPATKAMDGAAYANALLSHINPQWSAELPNRPHATLRQLALSLDDNYVLMSILTILRNMCHDAPNEVFVGSSYPIMNHCVYILMSCTYTPHAPSEACLLALELLTLAGKKIDLSGKRRLAWSATSQFLIGTGSTTKNAGLPLLYPRYKRCERALGATHGPYTRVVLNILPWCAWAMGQVSSRALAYKATELVGKLAHSQDNQLTFARAPYAFYAALVDLLCVSVTAAEVLVAVDPTNPDSVGRHRMLPARCTNFFLDLSDYVLRDCALLALMELCTTSYGTGVVYQLQERVLQIPNVMHLLYKIAAPSFPNPLDTRHGKVVAEGQGRAVQILTALQLRNAALQDPCGRVSVELSLAVCHENLLQEHFGEKLFAIVAAGCEARLMDETFV